MPTKISFSVAALFTGLGLIAVASPACGSTPGSGFGDATDPDGGLLDEAGNPIFGDSGTTKPGCKGLQCQQVDCAGGATTSLSGTAFAPNGTLPLYNVIVYVPNSTVDPLVEGVTCDKCGSVASGSPVVTALSDSSGKFKLTNVPVGDNIPLVLQVGKWRRQVVIPHVEACKDTTLTAASTRLPAKQSEGHMPHIAVTTGGYDSMACLLPKMGIDPSEFGVEADIATKRVIFYQGEPVESPSWGAMTGVQGFWTDANQLKKFDMVMLSCEGDEHLENKPAAARTAMDEYLKAGGRALGTDFMYTWFRLGPAPLPTTADSWYGGAPFDGSGTF
ncbi:MAG: carboxypeptidase regulatory-like domain-containing protein, partial [Polyangiaceae bacterium]